MVEEEIETPDTALKEFLESELGDYSHFKYKIVENDNFREVDYKSWNVEVRAGEEDFATVYFRYDLDKKMLEVELGEDTWEEVESFNYTVKYFWMALLKWE